MLYYAVLYLCAGFPLVLSGEQFLTHRITYHESICLGASEIVQYMPDANS